MVPPVNATIPTTNATVAPQRRVRLRLPKELLYETVQCMPMSLLAEPVWVPESVRFVWQPKHHRHGVDQLNFPLATYLEKAGVKFAATANGKRYLVERCWNQLRLCELAELDGFLKVEQTALRVLLAGDDFAVFNDDRTENNFSRREVNIWKNALEWADDHCLTQGLLCTGPNRREVLGAALHSIRFPLMDKDFFFNRVVPTEILTTMEAADVFASFLQINSSPNQFSNKKRNDGNSRRNTVDYARDDKKEAEEKRMPLKRPNDDFQQSDAKRIRQHTPPPSTSQSPPHTDCIELRATVPCTWKGMLMLNGAEYPMGLVLFSMPMLVRCAELSLYCVFGREHLIQDHLRDLRLQINNQLPLSPGLHNKLIGSDLNQLALMFATERWQHRGCAPLVNYLQVNNVAGVISLDGAVVYVLGHSPIAVNLVESLAPHLRRLLTPKPDHLLLVLKTVSPSVSAASAMGSSGVLAAVPSRGLLGTSGGASDKKDDGGEGGGAQ